VQPVDRVRAGHQPAGQLRDEAAGARVAADVGPDLGGQRAEPAVRVEPEAQRADLAAAVRGGGERLVPVLDPAHRAAQPQRGGDHHQVLRVGLALRAERAADRRDDHPHRVRVEPERRGQRAFQPVRRLVGDPDGEPAGRLRPGQDAARLHRGGGQPLVADRAGDHDRAAGQLVRARLAHLPLADHIGQSGVEGGGIGRGRGERVEHRRQRVDVDLDQFGAVLGPVPVGADDDRDRVADEPDPVGGQRRPSHRRGFAAARRGRDGGQVGQVGGGPGGEHAGQLPGRPGVDGAQPAVCRPGAGEGGVQAARHRQVGDVPGGAAEHLVGVRRRQGPADLAPTGGGPRLLDRSGHRRRLLSAFDSGKAGPRPGRPGRRTAGGTLLRSSSGRRRRPLPPWPRRQ
jgi:hypothetical protein